MTLQKRERHSKLINSVYHEDLWEIIDEVNGQGEDIEEIIDGTLITTAAITPALEGYGPLANMRSRYLDARDYTTVQRAYDDLPDDGGAILFAGGERYDVEDGVTLDRDKPAEFLGTSRWARGNPLNGELTSYPSNDPVLYSSTGAPAFFTSPEPDTVRNGYGFGWKYLTFEATSGDTEAIIQTDCVNTALVDDCRFWFSAATPDDVIAVVADVDTDLGDDASWWRLTSNMVSKGALCRMGSGNQSNRHYIAGNIMSGRGYSVTSAPPLIDLVSNHGTYVGPNNLEFSYIGIRMDDSWGCTIDGPAGEGIQYFVDVLDGCHSNYFQTPGISVPSIPTDARIYRLGSAVANNIFVVTGDANYGGFDESVEIGSGGWRGFNTWMVPRQYAPEITGDREGNAALAALLSALAENGWIKDSTS